MHYAKINEINSMFVFKNLRGRKVPCRVPDDSTEDLRPPLPSTTNLDSNSKFSSLGRNHVNSSGKICARKNRTRVPRIKKRSLSRNSLDKNYSPSPSTENLKDNKARRPKTISGLFQKEHKKRSRSRSVCSLDFCCGSPKTPERPGKRSYRKKTVETSRDLSEPTKESSESRSEPVLKLNLSSNGRCSSSFQMHKKRVYRKKNMEQNLLANNFSQNEPKRRSRTICNLDCCRPKFSTSRRKKKRSYNNNKAIQVHSVSDVSKTNYPDSENPGVTQTSNICPKTEFIPSSTVVVEVRKKRAYRKKGLSEGDASISKRKPKISLLNIDDPKVPSATVVVEISKKRTYTKKKLDLPADGRKTWSRAKVSTPDLTDDNAIPEPSNLVLPDTTTADPLNDSESTITLSQSDLCASQNSNFEPRLFQKRGRGRPRKSSLYTPKTLCPAHYQGVPETEDDEATLTCSTTVSSCSRDCSQSASRPRRKRWPWEDEELRQQEEELEVSEYELMRRRNIEENMKMLKQIFMDQGLQFEEKSSDTLTTPKKRKSYTRLPLPPPRPKSTRIEVKRSSSSLDFSKFCQRL